MERLHLMLARGELEHRIAARLPLADDQHNLSPFIALSAIFTLGFLGLGLIVASYKAIGPLISGINEVLLKELTGKTEIRTISELWDPALKGRITMLSEMRDSVGLVMLEQGNDPADFTEDDFNAAIAKLRAAMQTVAGNAEGIASAAAAKK